MPDTPSTVSTSKPSRFANGLSVAVGVAAAVAAIPGVNPDVAEIARVVVTLDHSLSAGAVTGAAAVIAAVTHPPKALVAFGGWIKRTIFRKGK